MKEQLVAVPITPLSPEEIKRRKIDFPQALSWLVAARKIAGTLANGSYYIAEVDRGNGRIETFIIDGKVVKAMNGGIQRMYVDLAQAGEKEFADKLLQESLK